ncbi:hypothetical protein Tco_0180038 [Tanacetum coccineum]
MAPPLFMSLLRASWGPTLPDIEEEIGGIQVRITRHAHTAGRRRSRGAADSKRERNSARKTVGDHFTPEGLTLGADETWLSWHSEGRWERGK